MAYRRRELEDAQATQGGQAGSTPTVAGLIRYLAAAFSMSEERLQTYLDALHGIDRDAIEAAVNTIRDCVQYDRLPLPSMVRALALQATRDPRNTPSIEELEAQRATPEEIDAAFEQARRVIRTRCSSLSCWRCVIAQGAAEGGELITIGMRPSRADRPPRKRKRG